MLNKTYILYFKHGMAVIGVLCAASFFASTVLSKAGTQTIDSVEELGKSLYFDANLSQNRTQSCATCHAAENGFVDPRDTKMGKMVSLGDDGTSFGDRNAPTAGYAKFSPLFHKNAKGDYVGGQFLDGRELDLKGQAGGPPLNPVEMGMKDKASVVARLKENSDYLTAFKKFYGATVFDNNDTAYLSMTKAIEAFEKTDFFSPFDSKYDQFLRGEYKLSDQEELGRLLFFSKQFTNCNLCHQLKTSETAKGETFSNYAYHNIGVPSNPKILAMKQASGKGKLPFVDHGLLNNPKVTDSQQDGKFKVPGLRNIAVTGPYMHNGVFKDLKTVILFYNKYNSKSEKRQINPETGQKWRNPEVNANLSMKELETGPALDNKRINALVAFLKTLTDKRYEDLLK